jgi:hypothetical protein
MTRHTRWVNNGAFSANLGYWLKTMDQPVIDEVNSSVVCKADMMLGSRFLVGGEELFSGSPDVQTIPRWWSGSGLSPDFRANHRFSSYLGSTPRSRHLANYAGVLEYGGDCVGVCLPRRGLFHTLRIFDVMKSQPEPYRYLMIVRVGS